MKSDDSCGGEAEECGLWMFGVLCHIIWYGDTYYIFKLLLSCVVSK